MDVRPPKRGGEVPDWWRSEVEKVGESITRSLTE